MSGYPYCAVQGKLSEFLQKIREVGVPQKATTKWLESLGYKSTNDRPILQVIKFIGLADEKGTPQQAWIDYRGNNYKAVLGQAVAEAYSDLFSMYPDACIRSNDEIENFFSTKTTAGKQVIQKMASTFKTLCNGSEFVSDSESRAKKESAGVQATQASDSLPVESERVASQTKALMVSSQPVAPEVHIDIQVHISPESSPDQIEQIFSSMAKHLYK